MYTPREDIVAKIEWIKKRGVNRKAKDKQKTMEFGVSKSPFSL